MRLKINALSALCALALAIGCQGGANDYSSTMQENQDAANNSDTTTGESNPEADMPEVTDSEDIIDHIHNDVSEVVIDEELQSLGCIRASSSQKSQVNLGLSKKEAFLQRCFKQTNGSTWCDQVVRPNPRSISTFRCTYGSSQVHNLVHPDEATWKYPIEGVKILRDLSAQGIKINQIYNWWRPEPYNKNVGGAAGRHPYGTAIDVRFSSESEANRAFRLLCKMRSQKRIRAIGHYGSSSLHIGVGDRLANTWGKSCN